MKTLVTLFALAILGIPPNLAHAGEKKSFPVEVIPAYRVARGALGSARNSSDSVQSLSCYGGWGWMGCTAKDASGVTASCGSTQPAYLRALNAMSGDSYVEFSWDAAGNCTFFLVSNSSGWEPKY